MEANRLGTVELPAPTASPAVFAFGLTLVLAGLVTNPVVSVMGTMALVGGAIAWFRAVLPVEAHESVPVVQEVFPVDTRHRAVARLDVEGLLHRARLPIEIYPVSAGVKGGLAGSVGMAVLAMLYGLLSGHGIWYPINLLAAGFFPVAIGATIPDLEAFHSRGLLIATPLHLGTSLLVGVLYGAILPMIPRRPILLGGFIAPLMWSGLLYSSLAIINPVLNEHVDWTWFALSQVGFGLVAGERSEWDDTR